MGSLMSSLMGSVMGDRARVVLFATCSAVQTGAAIRPVLSFYLLTLALSWGYWLTLLASGLRVGPGSVAHFPGLIGPMLAAIVVTAVVGGRPGLRELGARMLRLGPRWPVKLLLALSPLVLGALACAVLALMGQPLPSFGAFVQVPGMPEHWPWLAVLAAVVVVNGFGEETGWRGFLTERLLLTHGRLRSTLVVALLWALWHVPLFWLNVNLAALPALTLFGWLFALVCGAFVLAQVYLATGHSILCVALWHVAFNTMVSADVGTDWFGAIVSTAVMVWGATVAVRWWRRPAGQTARL
jgi:uncharacterized protein